MLQYHEHLAEGGDINSLMALASLYLHGSDLTEINVVKGIQYLTDAAELGHATACGQLGYILVQDIVTKKRLMFQHKSQSIDNEEFVLVDENNVEEVEAKDKILSLLRFASNRADITGVVGLGYCHYVGYGVPKNLTKAIEIFQKANCK
jgi:TPR repeat protein